MPSAEGAQPKRRLFTGWKVVTVGGFVWALQSMVWVQGYGKPGGGAAGSIWVVEDLLLPRPLRAPGPNQHCLALRRGTAFGALELGASCESEP